MIFVTDEFSKMPEAVREASFEMSQVHFPPPASIAITARNAGGHHGLVFQGDGCAGQHLVTSAGEQLERHRLYAVAPIGNELVGVTALVAEIAKRHGPGRWWSTAKPVNYLSRVGGEGGQVRCARIDGEVHVILAAYYFWAPSEAVDDAIAAAAPKFKVGDRVRWWPDGKNDGQPLSDRYIDGVVKLAARHPVLTVTGSHWFTERVLGGYTMPAINGVVDTSVMPGVVEHLVDDGVSFHVSGVGGSIKVTADASLQPNEVRLIGGGTMPLPVCTASGAPAPWITGNYAKAAIPPEMNFVNEYMATPVPINRDSDRATERQRLKQQRTALDQLRARIEADRMPEALPPAPPPDPLDVQYDGVTLRHLLRRDRARAGAIDGLLDPATIPGWPPNRCILQELDTGRLFLTRTQRAAVSAHWSAELRAKVKASAERERNRVLVDLEEP